MLGASTAAVPDRRCRRACWCWPADSAGRVWRLRRTPGCPRWPGRWTRRPSGAGRDVGVEAGPGRSPSARTGPAAARSSRCRPRAPGVPQGAAAGGGEELHGRHRLLHGRGSRYRAASAGRRTGCSCSRRSSGTTLRARLREGGGPVAGRRRAARRCSTGCRVGVRAARRRSWTDEVQHYAASSRRAAREADRVRALADRVQLLPATGRPTSRCTATSTRRSCCSRARASAGCSTSTPPDRGVAPTTWPACSPTWRCWPHRAGAPREQQGGRRRVAGRLRAAARPGRAARPDRRRRRVAGDRAAPRAAGGLAGRHARQRLDVAEQWLECATPTGVRTTARAPAGSLDEVIDLRAAARGPRPRARLPAARGDDPAWSTRCWPPTRRAAPPSPAPTTCAPSRRPSRLGAAASPRSGRACSSGPRRWPPRSRRAEAAQTEADAALRVAHLAVPNVVLDGVPAGRRRGLRRARAGRRGAGVRLRRSATTSTSAPALGAIDTERGAKVSGSRFAFLTGWGALLELALVNLAIGQAVEAGLHPGHRAGAGAARGDGGHRLPRRARGGGLQARARRPVPRRHQRGAARGLPLGRGARRPAAALRRLLLLLPPRGRQPRQGHPRHHPRAPVRQGRDVLVRAARRGRGRARAAARAREGLPHRARAAVPRHRGGGRRPRHQRRPQVRLRGVAAVAGALARADRTSNCTDFQARRLGIRARRRRPRGARSTARCARSAAPSRCCSRCTSAPTARCTCRRRCGRGSPAAEVLLPQ